MNDRLKRHRCLSPARRKSRRGAVLVMALVCVAVADAPNRRLVRVRADYPNHPRHRARQSRQATVQLNTNLAEEEP